MQRDFDSSISVQCEKDGQIMWNSGRASPVQRFREVMSQGMVVGTFSKSLDPAFIEIMGQTGFDFVVLDLEHGPNTVLSLQNLIRAAEVTGLFPIVRVKQDTPSLISEVLDVGAGGIQAPNISCKEDAERVVHVARFAPLGMRGVCRFVRAASYSSLDRYEYFSQANTTVVVLQLEGVAAVRNIREILSVPGVDIIFVGPYDLSQSLGVPGDVDNPRVTEAMRTIVDECLTRNVVVGTFVDTIEGARKWRAAGVKYLCYSVDVGLFTEKCHETTRSLRG
ncbi:MAG: aldolase/citrate lyase family protein [Spirochaetia bacterium]|jgi:4-hydroxy-2-oxoheptanedioate aldolase